MAYISEATSWRARRRRRQWITLVVALVLLLGAGAVAYGFYSGALGGTEEVNVAALPPCPTSKPTSPSLTPDKVKVNVYNATTRNGLAAKVATALDLRTFQVGAIANDPKHAKIPGVAEIRYGAKGTAAAQLVAAQLAGAKLVKDARRTAVVDLVLGAKYQGLKPVASSTATPTGTPTCRPVTTPSPSSSPSGQSTGTPTGTAKPTS
ncbi:MAG TPA: LytR C-terminal domain-containing protein [Angustibacter sp.]|nr:LytR C-terminal domain-containing protein [Angustibacter sp.]